MARVYRAEHVALNKLVALKVVDLASPDKSTAHRFFLREGRTAAAVKHPNVVDITDVGILQGIPFLVMELLEGWDLETHLRERGFLPDAELVRLALPIIAGLAAAHDSGVVHRDLKPSNIFLARGADGDQVPKVLDFGISKLAHDVQDLAATPYGTLMGTPLYLPPEAIGGAHGFSSASDQYSLGVVLYECAVGRPPFQQDTLVSLLQRIATGRFDPPSRVRPDISAVLERAILRAMHPLPEQRFAHVRDLGRVLWELASPRTQVLWGRSFGDLSGGASSGLSAALGASSLSSAGSLSGGQLALSRQPHADGLGILSKTQREFVSAPQSPARARSRWIWLAGGSAVVIGASISAALILQPRAVGEQISGLVQQPERARLESALPEAPRAPVAAVGERHAAGAAIVAESQTEPAAESRRLDAKPAGAAALESRPGGAGRPKKVVARSRSTPTLRTKSEAPNSKAASPGADPEFPELFRVAPGSSGKSEGTGRAVGANQSPILD